MEMTKRKKIVGTVELVAAAAVLIVAVVFAPAYKTAVGESDSLYRRQKRRRKPRHSRRRTVRMPQKTS